MYVLELAGDEDAFALCEAERAASAPKLVAPGLATARGVDVERLRTLAYTHAAGDLFARTSADVASAEAALSAASFERSGSIAVRARDVRSTTGVSTREAERRLGSVLVDRGFDVDLETPDHELRVLFSRGHPVDSDAVGDFDDASNTPTDCDDAPEADGVCLLGWLAAESRRDFGERRPTDRPFFQPGSMAPLDARALVNIAGAGPDTRVVDPMCGTGGLLLEALLVGSDVVGVDAQWKMTRGSRRNLDALADDDPATPTDDVIHGDTSRPTDDVIHGDATALPLADGSADAVVFDAPYGRQSKIARHELADLVGGALGEARRLAPRAVVVADRSWEAAAERAGWTVERRFERRVHGTLVRHVHVLSAR